MERRAWPGSIWVALAILAVANVMSNRVLPAAWYVPWNLAVAVALVLVGRRSATDAQLGFARWRRGTAYGLTLLVLTAAVLLLAVAMPAFHELYEDRRVSGGVGTMLWHTLVRIPLGTVVLEEVAFRAVLPALFALRVGVLRGAVLASACFGLWHVLPAWTLNEVNPVATEVFGTGAAGTAAAILFAVVGTTLAGLWWCWIRVRAGSVLATMIAHVGTNSIAYAIAFAVAG